MTQEYVREKYKERLIREKQSYIAKTLGIPESVLSKFKTGRELWPEHLEALNTYLDRTHVDE